MPDGPRWPWLLAFLFLLGVDLAFLHPALFTSAVRSPADVTPHWPAFAADRSGPPPPPRNRLLQDWIVQFHPWQTLVREAWLSGRAPLWNDKSACGEPLLANSQTEAFSPFLPLLLLTGDQYTDWRQLAQLVVAQVLTLLVGARLGFSAAAGAIAALTYSFCSFMQVWAVHPHSATASFAPGILLGLLLLMDRATAPRFFLTSAFVAASLLAGHVETAAQAGLMAGALALLWALAGRARIGVLRTLGLATAAGATGILLASCVLLPFLDYLAQSGAQEWRRSSPDHETPMAQLATLLDPDWFGTAIEPATYHGAGNYPDGVIHVGVVGLGLALLGAVLGARRRPAFVLAPVLTGAAAIAIVCAPTSFARIWAAIPLVGEIWRWRFFFVATLPLALLAALGADEIARLLTSRVLRILASGALVVAVAATAAPPWRGFLPASEPANLVPPSRALAALRAGGPSGRTVELGQTIPAGLSPLYGVSSIRRYDAVGLRRYAEAFCPPGVSFAPYYFFTDLTFATPAILDACSVRWVLAPYAAADARVPAELAAVGPGQTFTLDPARFASSGSADLVVFRYEGTVRDGSIEAVLDGPAGASSWLLGAGGWTGSAVYPREPLRLAVSDFMVAHVGAIPSEALSLPLRTPGAADRVSLRLARGTNPFWVATLLPGGLGPHSTVVEGFGWLRISDRRSAMPLAYLSPAPRKVATETAAVEAIRSPLFDPHQTTIVEASDDLPTSRPSPKDRAEIVRREPGILAIDVTTTASQLLVVTDAYARGWSATVDGSDVPVYPANLVGMCCAVPAGRHDVRFRYAPPAFTAGCVISALTLLSLIFFSVRSRRRRWPPERR